MIDEGDWQLIFDAKNQNETLTIPLNSPVESILIKVSLSTPQSTWIRAGWLNQYWEKDRELWLLTSAQVKLNGHLMQSNPVNRSLLVFTPVLWLVNWNISIFIPQQSINQTSQKLDQTKRAVDQTNQKLDEVLETLNKDNSEIGLFL